MSSGCIRVFDVLDDVPVNGTIHLWPSVAYHLLGFNATDLIIYLLREWSCHLNRSSKIELGRSPTYYNI